MSQKDCLEVDQVGGKGPHRCLRLRKDVIGFVYIRGSILEELFSSKSSYKMNTDDIWQVSIFATTHWRGYYWELKGCNQDVVESEIKRRSSHAA